MKKVIVIGSGIGGLSLAIRLQAKGFQVAIFEKNEKVGGHAYPLEESGFHFDMGPSLITAPSIISDLFQTANRNLSDYLNLIPLEPFYRIYFHDGNVMDYSADSEKMKQHIGAFHPPDAERYDDFIRASKKIHDVVIGQKLGSKPFMTAGSMLSFMPKAIALKAVMPAYQYASRFFKDERNRFTFSFHPLFLGGNPFRSPAVYQMIPYLEKTGGVWYTKGGMTTFIKALQQLFKERGGTIRTNAEVEKIIVQDGSVKGVNVNGEKIHSDAVVSNADFIHTFKKLIDPNHRKKWTDRRLEKIDYSMSAFLLYIGVEKKYDQLKHHTLVLSQRYRSLIENIFDDKILPDDFSLYLHTPSRTDDTMAPAGCESIYVLSPVTNLLGNVDWSSMAEIYKNKILAFLENDFGLENFREKIRVCKVFTPEDFKIKNNNTYGSAWGVEPKLTQTAILRPHNKCKDIRGLYLVGASTHPGAGLPGVMMTAETTEQVLMQDYLHGAF